VKRLLLGRSAVEISRVVHGCMAFDDDDARAVRAIHAAFDAGVTTFDTAPLYAYGRSEELLGAALADRRSRAQILTKVGLRWDTEHGQVLFESKDRDGTPRVVRRDSRGASIRQEVEHSLRRLRVDVLDLVQIHRRDADTPIAESMAALADLVGEGKVRAVGVSNFSLPECREAAERLGAVPLASAQHEYNLAQRTIERDVLPWAVAAHVGVLAYSPLAQGVLAGRQLRASAPPGDWRRGTPYYARRGLRVVHASLEASVLPLARARGVTAAQICLAWLLAQPGVAAVIAGASTPEQAGANAAAAELALDADERRRLDESFRDLELARRTPALRVLDKVRSVVSRRPRR
jgi:aryl-alcohol dehydrogenase-like predicted oxidoreductase